MSAAGRKAGGALLLAAGLAALPYLAALALLPLFRLDPAEQESLLRTAAFVVHGRELPIVFMAMGAIVAAGLAAGSVFLAIRNWPTLPKALLAAAIPLGLAGATALAVGPKTLRVGPDALECPDWPQPVPHAEMAEPEVVVQRGRRNTRHLLRLTPEAGGPVCWLDDLTVEPAALRDELSRRRAAARPQGKM